MTDLIPPEDDRVPARTDRGRSRNGPPVEDDREVVRRIAAAHTAASRDLEALLRRLPDTPNPALLAEYAALLAREEALRTERQTAATAVGLDLPSVGSA